MAIRINTEDNEIIVSDVATEETLKDLLKAVETMANIQGKPKKDPEVKKTQDALKDLAKSNKDLTIKMTDWTGNFDDTMDDLSSNLQERGKMIASGLGKIVKNTGNIISDLIRGPASFESFGRAIQAGAGAIGDGLGAMVDSFQVMGTKIPGVGAGLAMVGAAAGAAAMAIAAYAQNMMDGFVALSQSGANYNADIVRTASQIQRLGLNMNAFTQIVQQNAQGLAHFGGSVSLGAKRFVELTDVMHQQFGGQLYTLGLTFDEQAEQMAKFTQTQSRNTAFQNMSYQQQSVLFKDYITDLTKLTGLTGKSRQQLADEISQNNLRADADLRLSGATVEAQKALQMAFSASGGQDSVISQLLMAGIAGKDLAMEMAGGNTAIKNFMAGNSEAAQKIRDLGDAVATGKISQDEFHKGMREVLPSVEQTGKEFMGLYGISDIATTMTDAGASVQKYNVQMEQLQKAEAEGLDGVTESAGGTGGAILELHATLVKATSSIKSGVNTGIADFVESMGFSDAKDLGDKIKARVEHFTQIGEDIGDTLKALLDGFYDFYVTFGIIAKAPWDWIVGGTSREELNRQLDQMVVKAGFEGVDQLFGEGTKELLKDASGGFTNDDLVALIKAVSVPTGTKVPTEYNKDTETWEPSGPAPAVQKFQDIKSGNVAQSQSALNLSADLVEEIEKIIETNKPNIGIDRSGEAINGEDYVEIPGVQGKVLDTDIFTANDYNDRQDQGLSVAKTWDFDSPSLKNFKNFIESDDFLNLSHLQFVEQILNELILQKRNGGDISPYISALKGILPAKISDDAMWTLAQVNPPHKDMKGHNFRAAWNNYSKRKFYDIPELYEGGYVSPGTPHFVGERGPEIWSPGMGAGGTVTPFEQLATAEHSESLLNAVKKLDQSMVEFNTTQLKANEMFASLTSEQISKLTTLVNNTRTGNKIASTMASNG